MTPTREQVEELLAGYLVGPDGHDPVWDDVKFHDGVAMHYDPWGEPCSLRVWCRLFEAAVHVEGARDLYYFVGDEIVEERRVSTVWTGGHGAPAELYETRVLGPDGPKTWHYPTREAAEQGHCAAVALASAGLA